MRSSYEGYSLHLLGIRKPQKLHRSTQQVQTELKLTIVHDADTGRHVSIGNSAGDYSRGRARIRGFAEVSSDGGELIIMESLR